MPAWDEIKAPFSFDSLFIASWEGSSVSFLLTFQEVETTFYLFLLKSEKKSFQKLQFYAPWRLGDIKTRNSKKMSLAMFSRVALKVPFRREPKMARASVRLQERHENLFTKSASMIRSLINFRWLNYHLSTARRGESIRREQIRVSPGQRWRKSKLLWLSIMHVILLIARHDMKLSQAV